MFEQPVDHRFFEDQYLPGEDASAALMRMFRRRQMLNMTDEQTIESMAMYQLARVRRT